MSAVNEKATGTTPTETAKAAKAVEPKDVSYKGTIPYDEYECETCGHTCYPGDQTYALMQIEGAEPDEAGILTVCCEDCMDAVEFDAEHFELVTIAGEMEVQDDTAI